MFPTGRPRRSGGKGWGLQFEAAASPQTRSSPLAHHTANPPHAVRWQVLEAQQCYGSTSLEHPAVSMIATERGPHYLGGSVTAFELPSRSVHCVLRSASCSCVGTRVGCCACWGLLGGT